MQKKYKIAVFLPIYLSYIFHFNQKSEKISRKVILNLILLGFLKKFIALIINNK